MFKYLIPFILSTCFCLNAFTQHTIKGRVVDENKQALSFATVALLNPGDSLLKYFGVTNAKGEYQIKGIKKGNYLAQFSFVGMETAYDQITIPLESGEDLGEKQLRANVLEEVIVEAELIPVKFKNDTLEFDVKAFKTRPGAAAEELLRQLPGVEVDESGNIKAEGEEVVKVLVDGKEFFDDDPKVATKNLPAKALSKVQVIDRKTEESIFSGIDDGLREKTINLKLKEDHKKGYFGEINVGVGTNDTYRLDGKVYRFTEKTQNAILGMFNNINEFGFTNKDNNQFGLNNKGINEALAAGLNLSYNPSAQNRYFLSYLGNRRQKDLEEEVLTENFLADGTYEQDQNISAFETDRPHKLNFGVRHNFNKNQRLIIDGSLNVSTTDATSQTFTQTQLEDQLINALDNETGTASDALNFYAKATYISKINQDRNQIKAEILSRYNNSDDRLDWINRTTLFEPFNETLVQQFQTNDQDRFFLNAIPSFLHKINPRWSVSLATTLGIENMGLYRDEGRMNTVMEFEELDIPDFKTENLYLKPSLILNWVGKKAQLNIKLEAASNQFDKILNETSIDKEHFWFFTPSINYQNQYREGRRINIRYAANYLLPTTTQLIPVENVIDQLNIIQGNVDLEPEKSHQLFANWIMFDQFSFTALSVRIGGTYIKDKIRWAQSINEDLVKISNPVNVDDDFNLSSYIDFSTPIRSLGINLNITSTENWNRSLVFINEEENVNTNFTHSLDLGLENRKNQILAIRLGASISLTDSRFSIAEAQNNIFLSTSYNGSLRYTPNRRWNFEARANIINYDARSFDEAVSVPLISANMSYFFLKAEKGALTLSVFDLLNQYTGLQRISDINFLMQREWNTLTQYFMLTFNMRFR